MREVINVNAERAELITRKYQKDLEKALKVKIHVEETAVSIEGEPDDVYFARPVIKAIARGFTPDTAIKIIKGEYELQVIDLKEFCNTEDCQSRIKARVIGRQGSIKTTLERATDSYIAVYGHTVAVIAPHYSISYALEALRMIMQGSEHATVLNYLAKARKDLFYGKLSGKI